MKTQSTPNNFLASNLRPSTFLLAFCPARKYLLSVFSLFLWSLSAFATTYPINISLNGSQEVPGNASAGLGSFVGTYDDVTNILDFDLSFTGLASATTAAHLHAPAVAGVNAPVVIGFAAFPSGVTAGTYSNTYVLTAGQETDLLNGLMYVNVHTSAFPGGEIRAQLTTAVSPNMINIVLNGSQEVPTNASAGLGLFTGTYDAATNILDFDLSFTGLSTPTSVAHLHSPGTIGVNAPVLIGFAGFPLGVTSGTYSNTYVLTASQEADLLNGLMYVNIHTTGFPGGEIRAQLSVVVLPIQLLYFTGHTEAHANVLEWATATEKSTRDHIIERSANGITEWQVIGRRSGAGTSIDRLTYAMKDEAPLSKGYYRLRSVDLNGSAETFNMICLDRKVETFAILEAFPVPTETDVHLLVNMPADGVATMTVIDASGHEMKKTVFDLLQGTQPVKADLGSLPAGPYYIRLNNGKATVVARVVKAGF